VSTQVSLHGLDFELRRSSRRRSVEITVERDCALMLSAPPDCSTDVMEKFVHDKLEWIYGKLALKGAAGQGGPARRFVSGEGFPYLGRNYRLLMVDEQDVPLKLANGRLCLLRGEQRHGRKHLVAWYVAHGQPWLERRVERFAARVGVEPGAVRVMDLGYRWGSCCKAARVNFLWRTVLLPPPSSSTWSCTSSCICWSRTIRPVFGGGSSGECPILSCASAGWRSMAERSRGYERRHDRCSLSLLGHRIQPE
jgi:predicted metal-dependent hydrolase